MSNAPFEPFQASPRLLSASSQGFSPLTLRFVELDDAAELAESYRRNKEHLKPWEPSRPAEFFTEAGQRAALRLKLDELERGSVLPWLIIEDHRVIGTMTVSGIVRGPFLSGNLGYWVDAERQGTGIASRAVAEVCRLVSAEHGLHRLQASTLLTNVGSQRVLKRNGFTEIGSAPDYLKIDGRWQDNLLFQRIFPESDG
ncbi:GNAT family N-acetyltransferase [Psychromicrobium sp. YIM B11713]|uniref:GNAT family N-acetyltransferase n=1 Tax=Psychromicrobium sp. YIM B11713 TaxID=3145233 RepID=UPI00374E5767